MKFIQCPTKQALSEPEVCLKIFVEKGVAKVVACDPHTGQKQQGGYLLNIGSDGTMRRVMNVSNKLGFLLDCDGRVKFTGEELCYDPC